MLRVERLNNDMTGFAPTSRSPGNLRQQLKGAFTGAEIGHIQRRIRRDNSDQSDACEVQPFSDHLRTDQNIRLAGTKSTEHFQVGVFLLRRIPIHTDHAGFREKSANFYFHLFGADSEWSDAVSGALRADAWGFTLIGAMVADKSGACLMKSQGDIAVRATRRIAAVPAEEEHRKAAPVEEKNGLLAFCQTVGNRFAQRFREKLGRSSLFPVTLS